MPGDCSAFWVFFVALRYGLTMTRGKLPHAGRSAAIVGEGGAFIVVRR